MYRKPPHTHTQIAVYFTDIPLTLKQSQGHQTCYESTDPKQGTYNHVKFEISRLNSVQEKVNVKVIVKSGNMSIVSLE